MVDRMSNRVAVIGCGMFGAVTAIRLSQAGFAVEVFERNSEPLRGASHNNLNRLHLGVHYPRDLQTALQCVRGFKRFCEEFPECVVRDFFNCYFVAEEGSLTTAEEFVHFCSALNVNCEQIAIGDFPIEMRGVSVAMKCPEAVYDSGILRELVLARMRRSSIAVAQRDVVAVRADGREFELTFSSGAARRFDAVVNASYANTNRFDASLGLPINENQYEYTFVPVIETSFPQPLGITIMDGRFITILPFGKSNKYLLYHVEHSVIERRIERLLPHEWLSPETGPLSTGDRRQLARDMLATAAAFVPALAEARPVGHLEGPRMVQAGRDATDARPSIVRSPLPNYVTIFSGKIDHSMWVADEVIGHLGRAAEKRRPSADALAQPGRDNS
jgi:glycine/D-amino acid oxidase-like deaminating enzyme